MEERVILVDKNDNEIGTMEKMHAHMNGGKLHRAISIFIFNKRGELMLQQRAFTKYHAKGKWSNTVCSHPRPGENIIAAAHRRLVEEMGFDCKLKEVFDFTYTADVGSNLTENEFDHVLFGEYDKEPKPNPDEAAGWKWVKLDELKKDIAKNPDNYTPWLRLMFDKVLEARNIKT